MSKIHTYSIDLLRKCKDTLRIKKEDYPRITAKLVEYLNKVIIKIKKIIEDKKLKGDRLESEVMMEIYCMDCLSKIKDILSDGKLTEMYQNSLKSYNDFEYENFKNHAFDGLDEDKFFEFIFKSL